MPVSRQTREKIKADLKLRREEMLKLLDLERHWPSQVTAEKMPLLETLIQQKEAIIGRLEKLEASNELPKHDLASWLRQLPLDESAEIAASLEMLRELTILTLDWHQKNVGVLNLRAEELAKVLQGTQQWKAFMQALRETQSKPVRLNLVG